MNWSSRLPLQRRRSRWERLRDTFANRARRGRGLWGGQRLPAALPDPVELRRRVQPLVERAAAARPDIALPEPPAFLQDRLDLLAALGRGQPVRVERGLPVRTVVLVLVGVWASAFVLGYMLGRAGARRVTTVAPEQLEAAAQRIKDVWPGIHDDDIREARGNLKRLSNVIAERTGESMRSVRERLTSITAQAASVNGDRDRS